MNGYLGEKIVEKRSTPFKHYKRKDWVLWFVSNYGHCDGEHHKQWLLDQVARVCLGSKIIIKEASWENGLKEYRVSLGKENKAYKEWAGDDWDSGIAP